MALTIGFPAENGQVQSYSIGLILEGEDARNFKINDQSETTVPFDPIKEFIVLAKATAGMSGGGVFDDHGRYLGVMVRAGQNSSNGEYFIRVLKSEWIKEQVEVAAAQATPEKRALARSMLKLEQGFLERHERSQSKVSCKKLFH